MLTRSELFAWCVTVSENTRFLVIYNSQTKKVLSLDTWFQMHWEDARLAWDEDEEFENISQLSLPAKSVWVPDITLYNR